MYIKYLSSAMLAVALVWYSVLDIRKFTKNSFIDMRPDLQEGVLYAHHFNTQISPPFYRYIIRQSMGACIVHQSAFPEAVCGACQTSMNARFVFSCPCWLLNKGHRAVRSHTTL